MTTEEHATRVDGQPGRDGRPTAASTEVIPRDFSCDARSIRYGTLGVPLDRRREPTDKDFADPRFDVIWELIKRVDVDFQDGTLSGATGNDVCAVLDALNAAATVGP